MLIGTKCSKCVCYIETLQNVSVETLFNQQRKWNTKSHIKRSLMNFILMRILQSGLWVYGVEKLREYHHTWTQVDKHCPQAAHTFSFCVLDRRQVSAWLRCTVLADPLEKSEIHLRCQYLWLSISKFTLRGLRQVLQCRNSSFCLDPDGFSKDCGFCFHPLKGQEEREGVWEGPLEHSIMDTPDGKQTGLAGRDSFLRLSLRRWLKTYIPRECGSVYISLGPFVPREGSGVRQPDSPAYTEIQEDSNTFLRKEPPWDLLKA